MSLSVHIRPGFWKTADGREIPIAAMQNEHLKNTISMLRRQAAPEVVFSRMARMGSPPNGEMAELAWRQELLEIGYGEPTDREVMDALSSGLSRAYHELLDEWNLRKRAKVV